MARKTDMRMIVLPAAKADLIEIGDYIAVDNPARAMSFIAEIEAVIFEKLRILGEIDRAAGIPGAIGAILRREGLYSSAITDWRRQREAGAYEGLSPVKRGPKPVAAHPLSAEHAKLQRDYKRLEKRLERAEAVIDIQKKLALLLGHPIEDDGKS